MFSLVVCFACFHPYFAMKSLFKKRFCGYFMRPKSVVFLSLGGKITDSGNRHPRQAKTPARYSRKRPRRTLRRSSWTYCKGPRHPNPRGRVLSKAKRLAQHIIPEGLGPSTSLALVWTSWQMASWRGTHGPATTGSGQRQHHSGLLGFRNNLF